jgi:hypothetical protein
MVEVTLAQTADLLQMRLNSVDGVTFVLMENYQFAANLVSELLILIGADRITVAGDTRVTLTGDQRVTI